MLSAGYRYCKFSYVIHSRERTNFLIQPIPKSLRAGIVDFFVFLFSAPLTFCTPPAHTGLGNPAKITKFFVFEVGGMGPAPFDSSSRFDPHPSSSAVHLVLQAIPLTSQLVQLARIGLQTTFLEPAYQVVQVMRHRKRWRGVEKLAKSPSCICKLFGIGCMYILQGTEDGSHRETLTLLIL